MMLIGVKDVFKVVKGWGVFVKLTANVSAPVRNLLLVLDI